MQNIDTLKPDNRFEAMAPVLFLLMWSSGAVMVKMGLVDASPWTFLFLRACLTFFFSTAVLMLVRPKLKYELFRHSKSDIIAVLKVGFFLQFAYLSTYILSIDAGISPGLVTMVLGFQPLITPFLAKEKLSKQGYGLLALGFVGLCIAVSGAKAVDMTHTIGLLFAFFALISLTFGTVKQKGINMNIESMVVYQNLFTLILFSLVALVTDWQVTWTQEMFLSLFWMSIIVSVGAVMLLLFMLKRGSASQVSMLFYCIPLLAILFDYLIFGEQLSMMTMVGIVVVAMAVFRFQRVKPVV
ncbi:DMT family transporter [Vibrio gangliei]|uniref:DMT family transporter n=1 Tax=Vibrio gangliei TaxID=2077090 RepID=UPI000D01B4F7|nr:DMT family transporter [Vibrio gangliei]